MQKAESALSGYSGETAPLILKRPLKKGTDGYLTFVVTDYFDGRGKKRNYYVKSRSIKPSLILLKLLTI